MPTDQGRVLVGKEREDYAEKNGLCRRCCETQVCVRAKKAKILRKWVPKQLEKDQSGTLIIYKGYCLLPTCYSLEEAKIELGEIDSKQPRDYDPITGQKPRTSTKSQMSSQKSPVRKPRESINTPRNNQSQTRKTLAQGNIMEDILRNSLPLDASESKPEGDSDEVLIIKQMAEAVRDKNYHKLIMLLERQQSSEEPMKVGLFLLCRCAYKERQENHPYLFGNDGWVKSLTTAINDYSKHNEIQKLAVAALASLSYISRQHMTDIVRHGGVNFVLSIMNSHENNHAILDSCCCALYFMVDARFSLYDDRPQQTGLLLQDHNATKVVEKLVSTISRSDSSEGKRWAIDALTNFALQGCHAEGGKSLSQLVQGASNGTGINSIVDSIRMEEVDTRLASSALSLLCIVSEESNIIPSEDLVISLINIGQQINMYSIHCAVLGLLGNLSFESQVYNNQLPCLVDLLTFFLGAYQDEEELQMAAIKALVVVMYPSEHRKLNLDWDEIVSAIVNAMESFKQNKELQTRGVHALALIASGNDACKLCIVSNKGIMTISKAIGQFAMNSDNYTEDDELRILACTVIAQIASSPVTCPALSEDGLIPLFLDVVHSMPRGLPNSVRLAIVTLSRNGAGLYANQPHESSVSRALEALTNSNLLEEIKVSMINLSELCELSPEMVKWLVKAYGGCGLDHVETIMTTHVNEVDLQGAGCTIFAATFKLFPFCGRCEELTHFEVGKINYSAAIHSAKYVAAIRRALSRHKAESSIVRRGMTALGAFLAGPACFLGDEKKLFDDTTRLTFMNSLEECLDIMTSYQNEIEIISVSMWYLRCMLMVDPMESKVCGSRLFAEIFESVCMHDNIDLRINACCALLSLIHEDHEDEMISATEGGLLARALMLCLGAESEELVEVSSELTAIIIYRAVRFVGDIIDAKDSIRTIVSCMIRNDGKPDIICNCCMILASIVALHDDDDLPLIIEHGGLSGIVNIMDNYSENRVVIENSSKALRDIVKGTPSECLPPNLFKTIMNVMEENIGNPDVMSSLLETIWHLSSRESEYVDHFSTQQAISSIIETMNLNIPDVNVQSGGCAALWSLAIHGDNKHLIGNCGGLESITNSLMAHLDSVKVQKEGLTALKNLATTSKNKQTIREYGGEEAIVYSMRFHNESEEILSSAFAALNNIAVDIRCKTVAPAPNEVFDILIAAMVKYRFSESVQTNACFLLKSYTFSDENLAVMKARTEDFMSLLTTAAGTFPQQCGDKVGHIMDSMLDLT